MICLRRRKNNRTRLERAKITDVKREGAKSTWCGRHVRLMKRAEWTLTDVDVVTCEKCKNNARVARRRLHPLAPRNHLIRLVTLFS